MADEFEVNISDDSSKDDTPVSFIENDNETLVTIGDKKETDGGGKSGNDEERWRAAEADRLRLQADFNELRTRVTGVPGSQPSSAPAGPDPFKAEEDAITEQERALGIQWEAHKAARSFTPELVKDFDQKSRQLQQRRIDISTQRAMSNIMPQFLAASQEQQFRAEYGDVRNNPQANRFARGHYDMLVAQGAAESPETVRQAMNAARIQFRLAGARTQPTDSDRRQFTGFGGTQRVAMEPKNNVVKMGKAEKGMAMAMYGDTFNGDEQKVYSQWAKTIGIKAQREAQKAARTRQ